eukprot:364865-Chlamydomonas_euryale.AAC.6
MAATAADSARDPDMMVRWRRGPRPRPVAAATRDSMRGIGKSVAIPAPMPLGIDSSSFPV